LTKRSASITVGANCLFKTNHKPFLLVEIEIAAPGVDIGPVIIISLTDEQFRALSAGGIPVCKKVKKAPKPSPGVNVEFKCVFIDDEKAFLIFDVENATDTAVLVRVSVTRALMLIEEGARQCTVISPPFDDAADASGEASSDET
jgi:hypothetical protein